MNKIVEQVAKKRKSIWEKEPSEIRTALTQTEGTFNESFFPAIYATEGSRNVHIALATLRKVLVDPESDVKTVKMMLKHYLEINVPLTFTWGGLSNEGEFIKKDVVDKIGSISSREDLLKLVEELTFYVGRLNYWLDAAMPWYSLVNTFEQVKEDYING